MIVLGVLLIIFSIFLIVAVLLQQGKNHNLSGTIAGGAETFFGKSKAQTMNKKLSLLTTIVAVVFVVFVLVVYCINTDNTGDNYGSIVGKNEPETTVVDGTTEHVHGDDCDHDHDADDSTKADGTTEADSTTVA